MKRTLVLLLALLFCGAAASGAGAEGLTPVICEEQGFTSLCDVDFGTRWEDGSGLYVYTRDYDSIPYVLIFRSGTRGLDLKRYFNEDFTPYMREKYGDDLVDVRFYDAYPVAGRQMVAAQYTYRLNDSLIVFLRAGDLWGDIPVFFGAKYVFGEGDATLSALETLVANLQFTDAADAAVDVSQILRGFSTYDDSRFRITLPTGWRVRTTGEFSTLTVKAWDPGMPERSISFCLKMEPFLKSPAAKDWYLSKGSLLGGSYLLIGGAPVLDPPTVPNLLVNMPAVADYCRAFASTGAMLDPDLLADLNDVQVRKTFPPQRPAPRRDAGRLRRADRIPFVRRQSLRGAVLRHAGQRWRDDRRRHRRLVLHRLCRAGLHRAGRGIPGAGPRAAAVPVQL